MKLSLSVTFAAVGSVVTLSATRALAWGPVGHETVAHIAEDNLTPKATAAIAAILGRDTSLADVANYADQIRPMRPETAPWHFIDIPDRTSGLGETDEPTFCVSGNCVVDQIGFDVAGLQNASTAPDQRAQFLKFLVHFVGDVHQPLHCANDDDRGGNDKWVRYVKPGTHGKGRKFKLHAAWDGLLDFGTTTEDARELASQLEDKIGDDQMKEWSSGTPADWAWESFKIAHDTIYSEFSPSKTDAQGVPLPKDYYGTKMRGIVETQIEKAGIRLAMVLNDIFK